MDVYESFAELKKYLGSLANQTFGLPASICETGEPYVEFQESALARPDDIECIERRVAERMSRRLGGYLDTRHGRIYWRFPFESDIDTVAVVARYDDNGPDRDPITDRKCVMDKNWRNVACYCRLYRATFMTQEKTAAKIRLV